MHGNSPKASPVQIHIYCSVDSLGKAYVIWMALGVKIPLLNWIAGKVLVLEGGISNGNFHDGVVDSIGYHSSSNSSQTSETSLYFPVQHLSTMFISSGQQM